MAKRKTQDKPTSPPPPPPRTGRRRVGHLEESSNVSDTLKPPPKPKPKPKPEKQ